MEIQTTPVIQSNPQQARASKSGKKSAQEESKRAFNVALSQAGAQAAAQARALLAQAKAKQMSQARPASAPEQAADLKMQMMEGKGLGAQSTLAEALAARQRALHENVKQAAMGVTSSAEQSPQTQKAAI